MVQGADVFVIGGGPAGLAAAIAARKKGLRVTVADGRCPSIDKACGEGLTPDGVAALQDLGICVAAHEGFGFRGIRFLDQDSAASADFPAGHGLGLRRPVLHGKLVEYARAQGVSFRWDTPVVGICHKGVILPDGVVPAKWIIGADGIGSRVRKWSGLDAAVRSGRRFAVRRHYRIAPWSDFMEIYWGANAQAYVTPVGSEEVCVVLISGRSRLRFTCIDAEFPELAQRLAAATPANAERGAMTIMQRLKCVYRGRVALIGDASGSVDAITGEGLCLGFRQALALADALEAGDLGLYQQAHRHLSRRPELMGRLMLLLDGRTALRERALRALASDGDVFARLLAVHAGAESRVRVAATSALLGWRLVAA